MITVIKVVLHVERQFLEECDKPRDPGWAPGEETDSNPSVLYAEMAKVHVELSSSQTSWW